MVQRMTEQKTDEIRTMTKPRPRNKLLNSKTVAFTAIISALGAILSISSFAIPLGPNLALDLSHIGTYIVAIGGGPILGAIAGALVGIIPSMSPNIANVALIPGKMLTGFSVGIIYMLLKRIPIFQKNRTTKFFAILIAGLLGYIPEMIFTVWDLYYIAFTFMTVELRITTIVGILIKAGIEIIVITVLTAVIYNVPVIQNEVDHLVGKQASIGSVEYALSGVVITASMLFIMGIMFGDLARSQLDFTIIGIVLTAILAVLIVFVILKVRETKKKRVTTV